MNLLILPDRFYTLLFVLNICFHKFYYKLLAIKEGSFPTAAIIYQNIAPNASNISENEPKKCLHIFQIFVKVC